jgi:micrococcal nuclease
MRNKAILFLLLSGLVLISAGIARNNGKSTEVLSTRTYFEKHQTSPTPQPTKSFVEADLREKAQIAVVTRVIDGDTIQIDTGQKVRYIGIDAPELKHPRKPIQCFAKEAAGFNKSLVEGKKVRLEKDVSETDKYGRLLRYVYLLQQDGVEKEIFVNEFLVRQGYAYASSYPPDIAFQEVFQDAQADARLHNRGLWSACKR